MFVCLYGWNEARYQELLDWAGPEKRVAIVSREERKSDSPHVKIHHLQTDLGIEPLARRIGWDAVFLPLEVECHEEGSGFEAAVRKYHLAAGLILSEASDFSVTALKNARKNRGDFRRGRWLKNVFLGIPAIIVGAGPSLEKNRHLLKEAGKKALIFSGGTALAKMGIAPHFAAGIDPFVAADNPYPKVPFCYQPRVHPDSLKGEKILFPDSFSEAINWIYNEEMFNAGWTVGNFMTAIAVYMGCGPIIFVGMDYCYADGRKYATGEALETELIEFRGRQTQKDWLMAIEWTEELAKTHRMINATEGGILSLETKTLREVLKELPELSLSVKEAIEKLPLEQGDRFEEWDDAMQNGGEIADEKLLHPLWQIWKPVFARASDENMDLHKSLFYQRVIDEHR